MINKIKKYDLNNMYGYLKTLPEQIENSINIIESIEIKNNNKYSSLLFCGMGGSSIGSEFVISLLKNSLKIPSLTNNNYSLPNWINKETLIIITSYSGNTEESLSCLKECNNKGFTPIIITSGGEALKYANKYNWQSLIIPKGIPPRCAFGYLSSLMLLLLVKLNIIDSQLKISLENSVNKLKKYSDTYSKINESNNLIKLSKQLFNTNIIIYSTPNTKVCGYRLKSQLAENSKILSFYHYLPEMNHNDIEGYINLINKKYSILWIADVNDDKRVLERIKVSSKILNVINNQYFKKFDDKNIVLRYFNMILYFDWVSFYLSMYYRNNPSPVENIEKLKKILK